MVVSFFTLGCKVNQYETQGMSQLFEKAGHTVSKLSPDSNILIVNSCTVTSESDRKTRQIIRRFKRMYPNLSIVLTGCMAQVLTEERDFPDEVDLIIGNKNHYNTVDIVEKYFKTGKRIIEVSPHKKNDRFNTPCITDFEGRTRAYIKIEDGCNRFCSYCIIPTARGFVRSRPISDIVYEAQTLAQKGFCEIVLVGINLTAFGSDTNTELYDVVVALNEIKQIKRIRLGSLEPDQITDRTLEFLSKCEKFCPQFHLSLQSGCDKTLKEMNRHYDTSFYKELVAKINKNFSNPSVTTDIIVGFANETEEDFNESKAFIKEMKFARAHVFTYSRRKGTVAYNKKNHVPNKEKQRRSREMINLCNDLTLEFNKSQKGLICPVLFETYSDGFYEGYTKNYTRVKVKCDFNIQGKIFDVEILNAEKDYCYGKLV